MLREGPVNFVEFIWHRVSALFQNVPDTIKARVASVLSEGRKNFFEEKTGLVTQV